MSTETKPLDLLVIDLFEQQAALLKKQIIQLKINAGIKVDIPAEDSDKKKRPKSIVDPNKPKRSPSGYHLFMSDHTGNFKLSNPGMSQTEIMTIIAKRWTDLDNASRKVYLDKADKLKVQYSKELHEYELKTGMGLKKLPPPPIQPNQPISQSMLKSIPITTTVPTTVIKKIDPPSAKKRKADEMIPVSVPTAVAPAAAAAKKANKTK